MKISIITVGRVKEKFYTDAISLYAKQLNKHCQLELIEVSDEKAPETLSDKEEIQIKDREGERILSKIGEGAFVMCLAIEGKALDSQAFSLKIRQLEAQGKNHIAFVIGGSLGLSEHVLKRADFKLSFSPMTFPHQLMKVILMEQVCRHFSGK